MSPLIAFALAAASPPAGSCQAALGPLFEGTPEEALPGRVEGSAIPDAAALAALRRERGDALITVVGGSFAGGDFSALRLHNICFLDTDLSGSDWRGADAPGVGFVRTNLARARFAGARMSGIALREPDMPGADAAGADWSNGRLDGGWDGSMENVALDRADLSGFEMACGITIADGCPIQRRLSLRGADLSGASLNSWWFDADYAGARIDRTAIALHQLADVRGARLAGPLILRGGDAAVELSPGDYVEAAAALADAPPPEGARIRPDWVVPGARALFVNDVAGFSDSFRGGPLFRRMLPTVIGGATSQVAVRVNADGSIDAGGHAVGGNAHLCTLGGEGLRLDPATGWYSGPYEARPEDEAAWAGRPMPVLRFAGDRIEVYRSGHVGYGENEDPRPSDYASCGVRASFEPMVRVPVEDAEVDRILAEHAD